MDGCENWGRTPRTNNHVFVLVMLPVDALLQVYEMEAVPCAPLDAVDTLDDRAGCITNRLRSRIVCRKAISKALQ